MSNYIIVDYLGVVFYCVPFISLVPGLFLDIDDSLNYLKNGYYSKVIPSIGFTPGPGVISGSIPIQVSGTILVFLFIPIHVCNLLGHIPMLKIYVSHSTGFSLDILVAYLLPLFLFTDK